MVPLIKIFRLPRHRQFNYSPLYYDPEKEARETRIKEIKKELGMDNPEAYVPGIQRGSMRHYIKSQKRSKRNSTVRLIVILAILFFVSYLLLYY